ncbi:copper transporter [Cellulomonas chengniuliangii]|uniref:Copper transporter n=1 Tax=Cellulomonas chengniuliangii TaxID=2968084 RepID=A0ABY5KUC6_9CELL|nr:copper transporter [Cellulomonas chengniuliangii]MCC2308715.1 copper transporter [Cellulomonas chengniuliangii]MCC2317733.1 copper transporter [Cellulomonas chengniuliangii]UUI74067.1 copper transporter [Cellulomonas chengniuliangii]
MIDFRYHIVSLISVFLALAVGIALGAGPLKETIGDTLTGQVQALRAEKESLRTEADVASANLQDATDYIESAAPQLLAGALADRRVAVVALGEVTEGEVDEIEAQLTASGAQVSGVVTLAETWTDPGLRSFRQALVGTLVEYLDPAPADNTGTDVELATALVQALTGADPQAPDQFSEPASVLLQLLSVGDKPLVTGAESVSAPADAIVVLTPRAPEDKDEDVDEDAAAAIVTAQLAVVTAAQDGSEGAVLADSGSSSTTLAGRVIADDALSGKITTVAGADLIAGQVSVPLALNARIGGVNGHYGFAEGETIVPTRVALPPVDRTPVPPAADGVADPDGAANGAAG